MDHRTSQLRQPQYDAVVVGAGPNGLAAAIEMARAGRSTLLIEANETIGGAARSAPLTLPGFIHDVGAAILPLALASPFMRELPLDRYGLEWVYPPAALAHPLDGLSPAMLYRSVEETADSLAEDAGRYKRVIGPLAGQWDRIVDTLLGPPRLPRHPLALAHFGLFAPWPATMLARGLFRGERARALIAGLAAHGVLPLNRPPTGAFAVTLALAAHAVDWPFPRGGTQMIVDALAAHFRSLGGEIVTGQRVRSLEELPSARTTLLDLTPRQVDEIAGDRLPSRYRRSLRRFHYGPGVFKVDYALSGPIPWKDSEIAKAGTVHIGGTLAEIAASEREVARGKHPEKPFVLLAQQSLFDPTRAPEGKHTVWAYCHVPNGSTVDMSARIEAQIERFAPGFRDLILARSACNTVDMERWDANLIGGDIVGGSQTIRQMLGRPVLSPHPYATPVDGLYICSSSTPPGGGVHGMCGYHAARAALKTRGSR